MNEFFKIDKRIKDASDNALKLCKKQFEYIDEITEYNQQKVQKAFLYKYRLWLRRYRSRSS